MWVTTSRVVVPSGWRLQTRAARQECMHGRRLRRREVQVQESETQHTARGGDKVQGRRGKKARAHREMGEKKRRRRVWLSTHLHARYGDGRRGESSPACAVLKPNWTARVVCRVVFVVRVALVLLLLLLRLRLLLLLLRLLPRSAAASSLVCTATTATATAGWEGYMGRGTWACEA